MSQATLISIIPKRPQVKLVSHMETIPVIEAENECYNLNIPIEIGVSDVAFLNLKTDFPTNTSVNLNLERRCYLHNWEMTWWFGSGVMIWHSIIATTLTSSTININTSSHQMMSKFTIWYCWVFRCTVGQKTVPMFGCFAKIEVEQIKKIG